MDNYDMSVKMENLRILTRLHQEDDHFPDAYAAAVANHHPPRRDGQGYVMEEEVFHTHQGEQHIIMK